MIINRRLFLAAAGAGWLAGCSRDADSPLLLSSYEATREAYRQINSLFVDWYNRQGHARQIQRIRTSHGGSASQAHAVIDGLPADVVSFAVWPDTDEVRKAGLINNGRDGWEDRFPNRSCPFTSTIVFTVRQGNPFGIRDWPDLIKHKELRIITANPKTSGAAKMSLIACYGSVIVAGGTPSDAEEYIRQLFAHVKSLDPNSRAASVTFGRKQIGDLLLNWENEAFMLKRENQSAYDLITPPRSVLAEPHVAIVDSIAREHGHTELAEQYVQFLYSDEAQTVFASNRFRPFTAGAGDIPFAKLDRFTVAEAMGCEPAQAWDKVQTVLFDDGGLFDRVFATR